MFMATPLRFVTAASLFDGHDVSINIMRRILQSKGAEVIHLGHNRSALEVVDAAICEDAHAVALSSYQGGHMEYFPYVRKLLDERGGKHIRIFGGGGGVITAEEIKILESQGITKIYSPADGVHLGLEGIIDDMIKRANFDTLKEYKVQELISQYHSKGKELSFYEMAKCISALENSLIQNVQPIQQNSKTSVLGITGTGGAGKSSLIDELLTRFRQYCPETRIALISIDPTRRKTQGALLGDRIRLTQAVSSEVFIRSMATRDSGTELSPAIASVVTFLKQQNFQLVIIETSGIGQASDEITRIAEKSIYVMTPEYGAQTQLEKIEMLDVADFIAINKYEKARAEDALRDVRKQYKRNRNLFHAKDEELPIYGTMASKFNDLGVNALFLDVCSALSLQIKNKNISSEKVPPIRGSIIPSERINYLRLIASTVRDYNQETKRLSELANKMEHYEFILKQEHLTSVKESLQTELAKIKNAFPKDLELELENFLAKKSAFDANTYTYKIKDKDITATTKYISLSGTSLPIVALPTYHHKDDLVRFVRNENMPGSFPFASGIFPFKRKDEEPKRQFAGEGGPKRTNQRFHFLSADEPFKRLSTAFDSVTLYGEDPHTRPDIFGKIGESGVSIATLKDMEELYAGFDLTSTKTSVSMTINGPAPIILAMYFNAAVNQKLMGAENQDANKRLEIYRQIRGTVQADILKEDQAQNTCIFSLDFALKMMGDVQEYFCKNLIKNYYAVSISGYHIAEAGANPITQLAFTLANGFTYVEYYLSRGLKIDDFAENLSFFFSNGLDPEYSVVGRVARKIWSVTLKYRYGAKEKSQKLKYHIQTSGRSLHAQEIAFNDIRTTLQAYLALSDNCNSLHTNAYDEAITTPTTESVRRAMAIQLIINREFGLNKTDNPMQGAFLLEELSQLVEEAVLSEFERMSDRGGVLGAMESMYQRSKIQDESLHYEQLKDSGDFPIIGVNTFLSKEENVIPVVELTRASEKEKNEQIDRLKDFQNKHASIAEMKLQKLKEVALKGENIFEELLTTVQHCSLGQITKVLYEVGGKYRRNV
jgi:methylmalonyl-CoA mutase